MCDKTCDVAAGTIEHMSGHLHTSEATCPTCGNDEAIVRVRGNAFSSVCTRCRRADVSPLLDSLDLVLTEGETMEAQMFTLEAIRAGSALALTRTHFHVDEDEHGLTVELRLPVPPR